jgi:hypothetical protein
MMTALTALLADPEPPLRAVFGARRSHEAST